jgi:hypothetical protein
VNLDTFRIADLVIHDVPLPGDDEEGVILTDAPIELDADLRQYFQRKIIQSLTNRGLDVLADADQAPITRESVAAILRTNDQLVPQSHVLARHLYGIQNKRNSPGLLAVAIGKMDDASVISVLKLEREQGLRLQINRVEDRVLVDIEHLRNLTLTDKTKVFKTSVMWLDKPGDELSLVGRVSDDQRGTRAGEGIATFFLSRFLGCRLTVNPEVATRDYVKAVESFINGLENQEHQAEYHIALLATLQDQQLDISPSGFAETHVRAEDVAAYIASIEAIGLDLDASFQKDLTLAKHTGFKWYFEHGMTLIGRREDVESGRLVVPESKLDPVEIRDTLMRLTGR